MRENPAEREQVSIETTSQRPGVPWNRLVATIGYWINLIVQPALVVGFIVGLVVAFGYMQRHHGWFNESAGVATAEESDAIYACSMLCVFVKAPGRCPVCGMELQEVQVQGDPKDTFGITIEPAARRLANIRTVAAVAGPVARELEVLGITTYDETKESTVSAYVSGRVENLTTTFTGGSIQQGEPLLTLYSPDLFADQVALLQAKEATDNAPENNNRVHQINTRLYTSARRRLQELGLSDSQIDAVETAGSAQSRIQVAAPISGTVIEKLVAEGEYVKTGMPLLKIADLSKIWLMLNLFPADTAELQLGQPVTVRLQANPGRVFSGRVAFIDPLIDPLTRAVKVRVEIPNDAGLIRIGDYATATLSSDPSGRKTATMVPRSSVLINGETSIAFVETRPGRFEHRRVEVMEFIGDQVAIGAGIEPGELVASSGAFLIDSTFNIQGKVSLLDPDRAQPTNTMDSEMTEAERREIEEAFASLNPEDRRLAESQVICPVTEVRLGSMGMGTPIRVATGERDIMICCEGCRRNLLADPDGHFDILDRYHAGGGNSMPSDEPRPNNQQSGRQVPQMELPQMELPQMELPKMEIPPPAAKSDSTKPHNTRARQKRELPQIELPQMQPPSLPGGTSIGRPETGSTKSAGGSQ